MYFNLNDEVLYKGYNKVAKIIGIRALKSQTLYDLLLDRGKTILHVAEEEIVKLPVAKELVIMELPLECGEKYMITKDTLTTGSRLKGLYAKDITRLFEGISKRVKEDREVDLEDKVVLKEISLISKKNFRS